MEVFDSLKLDVTVLYKKITYTFSLKTLFSIYFYFISLIYKHFLDYGTIKWYHLYMGKHDKLLKKILQKPVSANLSWSEIENMIIYYGAKMKEGSGSRVTFILNDVVATFHRPHGSEKTDKGAVNSVIQFLKDAEIIE